MVDAGSAGRFMSITGESVDAASAFIKV